ncbi:MAG: hypothetical protein AB2697_17455 [Candidatus Thiodiazotropha endolucinida]
MTLVHSKITLEITDIAVDILQKRMSDSGLQSPIPGLIWAMWSDESHYKWQIGFYEKDEIEEGFLIMVDDLSVYVYQDWLLGYLDNSILDIANNMIIVRKDGIEVKPEFHPE